MSAWLPAAPAIRERRRFPRARYFWFWDFFRFWEWSSALTLARENSPVAWGYGEIALSSAWRSHPSPFRWMRASQFAMATATLAYALQTKRKSESPARNMPRPGMRAKLRELLIAFAFDSSRMATATT